MSVGYTYEEAGRYIDDKRNMTVTFMILILLYRTVRKKISEDLFRSLKALTEITQA